MGLLAHVLRPSGPTHGWPPCSFPLSLGDVVPMVLDLITSHLIRLRHALSSQQSSSCQERSHEGWQNHDVVVGGLDRIQEILFGSGTNLLCSCHEFQEASSLFRGSCNQSVDQPIVE
jgi:hypothetical protein